MKFMRNHVQYSSDSSKASCFRRSVETINYSFKLSNWPILLIFPLSNCLMVDLCSSTNWRVSLTILYGHYNPERRSNPFRKSSQSLQLANADAGYPVLTVNLIQKPQME
jgi:hypothetical protein